MGGFIATAGATAVRALRGGSHHDMGFPKIRGTISGVPIFKSMVFRDLYWGSIILASYHISYSLNS